MLPLTPEEQKFAEENHSLIFGYMNSRTCAGADYDEDDWYELISLAYIMSVKNYFTHYEKLSRYSFSTVFYRKADGLRARHYEQAEKKIKPLSLESGTMTEEDMTLYNVMSDASVEKEFRQVENKLAVEQLCKSLTAEEKWLLFKYYGGTPYYKISQLLGKNGTGEAVRLKIKRILKKINQKQQKFVWNSERKI